MAHAILMPKPGQMTEECVLVAWHKREGDVVRRGDVLFEIETDKSNMDVEAFDDGVLLRRYVDEGETVPVNSVCAYVGEPGEEVPDGPPDAPGEERGQEEALRARPVTAPAADPSIAVVAPGVPAGGVDGTTRAVSGAAAPTGEGAGRRLAISPRASRLAAEAGLDPRSIAGSGPGGRVVERDVRGAIGVTAAPVASTGSASGNGSAPFPTHAPTPAPGPAPGRFRCRFPLRRRLPTRRRPSRLRPPPSSIRRAGQRRIRRGR